MRTHARTHTHTRTRTHTHTHARTRTHARTHARTHTHTHTHTHSINKTSEHDWTLKPLGEELIKVNRMAPAALVLHIDSKVIIHSRGTDLANQRETAFLATQRLSLSCCVLSFKGTSLLRFQLKINPRVLVTGENSMILSKTCCDWKWSWVYQFSASMTLLLFSHELFSAFFLSFFFLSFFFLSFSFFSVYLFFFLFFFWRHYSSFGVTDKTPETQFFLLFF